jgi:two-component system sensor histidine kinase AgrC
MFLWSVALQYIIYTICFFIIGSEIRYKKSFVAVTIVSSLLTGYFYSIIDIFTAIYVVVMLTLTFLAFSVDRKQLIYIVPYSVLSSLLGDHLASLYDFFIETTYVVKPGDSLQLLHLAFSAIAAFILAYLFRILMKKFLHGIDRYVIGFIGSLVLFTYYVIIFYTRFSGETPQTLKVNTGFFIFYLVIGLFILFYYRKITNKKLADELLEQQVRLQSEYIKDLEKNYQELREFKHDYQNLLFSLTSYIEEKDLDGLKKYYDEQILPTRKMLNLFPANLSILDNMENPELRSLLSLKLMIAQEKGLHVHIDFPETVSLNQKHTVNLVRMIGIILDNAIEGAEITKKKTIELSILKKNNFILFRVANSTLNELPLNVLKQKGFSTKNKSQNDGLGLFILDELANSSNYLFLETTIENQRFIQTIHIQLT